MDVDRIRHILKDSGERMIDLSERLGDKGDRLDKWEKDLVRTAMIPAVKERLDMTLLEYMTGSCPPMLKEFEIN